MRAPHRPWTQELDRVGGRRIVICQATARARRVISCSWSERVPTDSSKIAMDAHAIGLGRPPIGPYHAVSS